jgi:tetratricopeptide (TPR) repeat protein
MTNFKPFVASALAGMAAISIATSPVYGESEPTGLAASYLSSFHARTINDPEAAARYLDKALKFDPENHAMVLQAFMQKAQSGDIEGALPYAEAAYSERPSLSLAPLLIATTHFGEGRFQEALALIERISGRSNIGLSLPLVRAWARAPLNDYTQALAALAPYEGRKEWRVLFAMMSGLMNEYYGRDEAALVYYRALADTVHTQPLSVLRIVAEGFHRLGHSEEAVAAVARYRAERGSAVWEGYLSKYEDPDQAPEDVTAQMGMAEALYAITRIRMSTARRFSRLSSAMVYAHLALHLNPDLDLLRRELAVVMSARGQYRTANAILRSIRPNEPGYLIARLRLAENLERDDRTDEAIELLEDLARRRPNLPEPLITVGDILRNHQRFEEAVDIYDRAFDRYPGGEPESWVLYYARGMALERSQKWDRAEKDFKRALQLNPEEASVLNYLGYSWLDRGKNVTEARRMIELAVSKKPQDGYIIDSLGWAMFLMGEYDESVVQLERAVTLNPSDATINEHLGDAYWKVGRETEARFQWRRALFMEPEIEQAIEIRDKMQRGLAQN